MVRDPRRFAPAHLPAGLRKESFKQSSSFTPFLEVDFQKAFICQQGVQFSGLKPTKHVKY